MGTKEATAVAFIALGITVIAVFVQSPTNSNAQSKTCYPPKCTDTGDLILPEDWHDWMFVGSPLTPNALNNGKANFLEFHNVYIEPCSYELYKKTNSFPEGTVFLRNYSSHYQNKIRTVRESSLRAEVISPVHITAPM
jgi:hypothetical protein